MGSFSEVFSHDPLDFRKDGASQATREAGQLGLDASLAGIAEQNRQYNETAGRLQPFFDQGIGQLQTVDQAGTIGGLDQRYGDLGNTGLFNELYNDRLGAVQQQLSSGGLTRSGQALTAAADVPQDVKLALEQMLFDRQSTSLASGQNAAAGLGAFGSDKANAISELLARGGDAQANAALGQAQIATNRTQNAVGAASAGIGLLAAFSDPRLKENMEPIGKIHDLTLYQWDWRPGVKEIIGEQNCIGYNADEVAEKYPDMVIQLSKYKAVKYGELNALLAEEIKRAA